MKTLNIQDAYWAEIIELMCIKLSSDEHGNHDLFNSRLKLLKAKFKIVLKNENTTNTN